jgi:hypothetical protein
LPVACLFAILVSDNVAFSCTSIGTQDDSVFEKTANDGRPGAGCLWKRYASIREEIVSVERFQRRIFGIPWAKNDLIWLEKSKPTGL